MLKWNKAEHIKVKNRQDFYVHKYVTNNAGMQQCMNIYMQMFL